MAGGAGERARPTGAAALGADPMKFNVANGTLVFRKTHEESDYVKLRAHDPARDVRAAEFGNLDRRTIGHDFRRAGAVEAIVGGANSEQLAHAMGNALSALNALFATYAPVNVATLREVMQARRVGRRKLRVT
jgi:hypothetical protein